MTLDDALSASWEYPWRLALAMAVGLVAYTVAFAVLMPTTARIVEKIRAEIDGEESA